MKLRKLGENMTEVQLSNDLMVLFSYNTPVASFQSAEGGKKTSKKWSRTTSKHINKWFNILGCNAKNMNEVEQEYFDNLVK